MIIYSYRSLATFPLISIVCLSARWFVLSLTRVLTSLLGKYVVMLYLRYLLHYILHIIYITSSIPYSTYRGPLFKDSLNLLVQNCTISPLSFLKTLQWMPLFSMIIFTLLFNSRISYSED